MYTLTSNGRPALVSTTRRPLLFLFACQALLLRASDALAHAVAAGDKGFIQESPGVMLLPFIYMGAK